MPSNRARTLAALLVALCLLAFSLACGGDSDDTAEDAADDAGGGDEAVAQTPYTPTGNEGSIVGVVNYAGGPPTPKPISMDQDPVCAQSGANAVAEDIVVNGDKLSNVFIYIKDGKVGDKNITNLSFAPPAQPAVLDQHGCHYVPHILGIQTKQNLEIKNSDATSHNVNVDAAKNTKFNQGQPNGAAPITKQFARAETLIPVKCNQHPWMRAYIGVVGHPFFAVSGPDGKFEIKGVPPGTYNLVAWHEKYPQGQTVSVTVGAKEAKQNDFSFTSDQLKAELQDGALKIMPALEIPLVGHH